MTGRYSGRVSCQRSFGSVASFASSGFTAGLLFQCLSWRLTPPPAPPGRLGQPQLASEGTCLSLSEPLSVALCTRRRSSLSKCSSLLRPMRVHYQFTGASKALHRAGKARRDTLQQRHVTTARQPHHVPSQH